MGTGGKKVGADASDATVLTRYGRCAWIYDLAGDVGSGGAIPAIKRIQLKRIEPGERVLYVGAGTGEDAVAAACGGANVTVLDISSKMLQCARKRALKANVADQMSFIHGNIMDHVPECPYDVVAANFFLDVFDSRTLVQVLAQLKHIIRPRGRLLVADFAMPNGPVAIRIAQWLYHIGACLACAVFANQPWIELQDYRLAVESCGMEITGVDEMGMFGLRSAWFCTITAVKPDAGSC